MGFKDLPGGSNSRPDRSAAKKTTAQQASAAGNSPQKQESSIKTKSSQ